MDDATSVNHGNWNAHSSTTSPPMSNGPGETRHAQEGVSSVGINATTGMTRSVLRW